ALRRRGSTSLGCASLEVASIRRLRSPVLFRRVRFGGGAPPRSAAPRSKSPRSAASAHQFCSVGFASAAGLHLARLRLARSRLDPPPPLTSFVPSGSLRRRGSTSLGCASLEVASI